MYLFGVGFGFCVLFYNEKCLNKNIIQPSYCINYYKDESQRSNFIRFHCF